MRRFTRERIILLCAQFFFFLNFSELILLPKYFQSVGLGPALTGMLMGAFSVSVLAALPLAGLMADRRSKKALFLAGAAFMALPSALYMPCADMTGALVVLRIMQGAGFACTFGIIGAMIGRDANGQDRKYLLGVLTVVGISTHALGPAMGEYLIAGFGYDALFHSAAASGAAAFVLGILLPPHETVQAPKSAPFDRAPEIVFSSITLGVIFGAVVIFLPPYLAERGVMNSSRFFIPFVTGSLLMWTVLSPLVVKYRERAVRIVMFVLMLPLFACIGLMDSLAVLLFCSILFGIGYGYWYPTLNACLIEANPSAQGRANALFVWSFNFGMLLVSVGFGFACEHAGYEAAFQGTALLGCLCMAVAGMMMGRRLALNG